MAPSVSYRPYDDPEIPLSRSRQQGIVTAEYVNKLYTVNSLTFYVMHNILRFMPGTNAHVVRYVQFL
jgi:hypothetical protein